MAKQDQKRYIVTYAEEHVSRSEAAKVLDTSASNLQDAMTVLASDAPEDESDCLHFESLGATALPLSEKEVAKLEKDDRVVQVVEDIKVFVFHTEHDQYLAGYRQAMRDIMGRGAGRGLQHEEHSCCCCHCQPCDTPGQPPVPPEPTQPIPWNISQVKAYSNRRPIEDVIIERVRIFAVGDPPPLPEPRPYTPVRKEIRFNEDRQPTPR